MEAAAITYKCPNCEAGLLFDAAKQKFICEFCISEFEESELNNEAAEAQRAETEERQREFENQSNEFICSSCGAEVITDENTIAGECYYCHNPIVLKGRVSGTLRPTKIIPFKLDYNAAKDTFLRYAKKKFFVPNDYFSDVTASKITGIYYPFWVTDADTRADMQAEGRIVRTWISGNYKYTEISKYDVRRSGQVHFEDITTSAISEEDKKMLEGILPYPTDAYVDFSMPYMQGFVAKKRNIEREALSEEVRGRMHGYAESLLRNTTTRYTSIDVNQLGLLIDKSHWEYSLMPIWILNYQKSNKNYTYAMNGYTGKLYGELPVSPWKLGAVASAVFALCTALCFLIGYFLF